jgi:hypothetical protein
LLGLSGARGLHPEETAKILLVMTPTPCRQHHKNFYHHLL